MKSLCFGKMQTVADMSVRTGKSIPNVTKVINQLTELGIVLECGYAISSGGRRPLQYRLNYQNLPNILSVSIDQYYTSIAIYDLSFDILGTVKTIRNPVAAGDTCMAEIKAIIGEALEAHVGQPIMAIGLTIPGFVDSATGQNHSYAANHPLFDLCQTIQDHFGIQTWMENDSTAIAIAEKNFGEAQRSQDVLVVNLNWGVGLGMIIHDRLFKGHSGYAGEFSHIPLSDENTLCSCGKRGCLEVEASLTAAVKSASIRLSEGEISSLQSIFSEQGSIHGDQLMDAANEGDQLAMESLNKIGFMLGKGVATLIHIINPEYVVISGRGAKVGRILLPQIQSALMKYSIDRLSKHTSLLISDLTQVQLLGGACVALEKAKWNI
ncbi:ROK family protein [Sphingobacterium corticibacter]|nr:ROK family protein [Sphingobacterium corticibacter]